MLIVVSFFAFKNKDYIQMINLYKDALNGEIKNKKILKNTTKGNY